MWRWFTYIISESHWKEDTFWSVYSFLLLYFIIPFFKNLPCWIPDSKVLCYHSKTCDNVVIVEAMADVVHSLEKWQNVAKTNGKFQEQKWRFKYDLLAESVLLVLILSLGQLSYLKSCWNEQFLGFHYTFDINGMWVPLKFISVSSCMEV